MGRQSLLPQVHHLGWARFPRASRGGLGPHRHPGCYEVCYIRHGSLDWWAGDQVFEVGPGQVYVTRPDELHGGVNAVMNPCEIYWLQVHLDAPGGLTGLPPAEARQLATGFAGIKRRCFPGSAVLPELFERALAEHRQRGPLAALLARSYIHALLATTLRDQQSHVHDLEGRGGRLSPPIQNALALIDTGVPGVPGGSGGSGGPSVQQLALAAGLGPSQFRRRFARETGFAPRDYLLRLRVRAAKQRLRQGQPVTRVAMQLGFASSQHLATMFKRWVGVTPREYRRLLSS